MTFNAPSFFAGIATVLGLLVLGAGGGVLMSNVLAPDGPRSPNKVERQTAGRETAPTREAVVVRSPAKVAEPGPQAGDVGVSRAEAAPAAQPVPAPVTPAPQSPAPARVAEPAQPPSTPQPAPEAPAQAQGTAQATPSSAPVIERPVSLTHPAEQPRASRREDERIKALQRGEERRRARERRREERRKLAEERRLREQMRREAERPAQMRQERGNDGDDEPEDAPAVPPQQRPSPFPFLRLF